MSKIVLNIVEPGTDPTTIDPVVPNTGLFTHGIGGPEATIIVSVVLVLAIVGIILAIYMYRKHIIIKSKKHVSLGLTALALLVSICTFTAFTLNSNKGNTNAIEGEEGNLTVNVSDEDLTIEVGDEPVFAVLPVELSIAEATEAGYTLTAYADSTGLVSTTNPDNTIPMITVEGDELTTLTDNTYGLAIGEEPEGKDDKIYTTMSTNADNPTVLKTMPEYTPTEENDTTTIYYGFYITPDIPYGTYINDSEMHYNATINTTLVTFDSNGLYFNEDQAQTTNEIEYIAVLEEGKAYTTNQIISGEYKEPGQELPYNFLGWSTDKNATSPTYTSEESVAEFLPITPNQPMTLYAVWQKATELSFDGNGSDGGEAISNRTIIAGDTITLPENTYTKEGYVFTGWNTVAEGTGESYEDQADYQAGAESANVTLYAQWEEDVLYMQDVATWGSTLEIGDEVIAVDNRDGKEYTVARLADGNIWMAQNLDHDIGDIDGGTYTSNDTDLPSGTSWIPTGSELTRQTSDTTWTSSNTAPQSYDPGDLYWNGNMVYNQTTCIESGGEWENNAWCVVANPTTSVGNNHYHLGNYYNWTAAVAMSNSSSYSSSGKDAKQSICPAGWKLPNGDNSPPGNNTSGTFLYLKNKAGLTAGLDGNIHITPNWFVYGGRWNGSFDDRGEAGYYWFSKTNNSSESFHLRFMVSIYGGSIDSHYYMPRSDGYSVRCLAR